MRKVLLSFFFFLVGFWLASGVAGHAANKLGGAATEVQRQCAAPVPDCVPTLEELSVGYDSAHILVSGCVRECDELVVRYTTAKRTSEVGFAVSSEQSVQSLDLQGLEPNSRYQFAIACQKGCAVGDIGTTFEAQTSRCLRSLKNVTGYKEKEDCSVAAVGKVQNKKLSSQQVLSESRNSTFSPLATVLFLVAVVFVFAVLNLRSQTSSFRYRTTIIRR
jgi:hypothetical protein